MTLIIPLSADPSYLEFCLAHCPDKKKVILAKAVVALIAQMTHHQRMSLERACAWMKFIEDGIKNRLFDPRVVKNSVRNLSEVMHTVHVRTRREQICTVMSRNSIRTLRAEDVPDIQMFVELIDCDEITEKELGFSRSSLCAIIDGIENGDFLKATA